MFRFVFNAVFYFSVVQWSFSELQLVAPEVAPKVKAAFQKIQIPTHDQWSRQAMIELVNKGFGTANKILAYLPETSEAKASLKKQ